MTTVEIRTKCCVAGGGPAGIMLGFLLARAGVDVVVLEKHADFLRDFRGDTVHPSTLRVLKDLGLLEDFLKLPHRKIHELEALIGDTPEKVANFSGLPSDCDFVAMMPQWDFLSFLAKRGAEFKAFRLMMNTTAESLVEEGDKVVGVRASGEDAAITIKADLVVAADGRHSTLRRASGLRTDDLGAPMDVLWFRLDRRDADGEGLLARMDAGRIVIEIDRGDYWQCADVIAKGSFEAVRARGFERFKSELRALGGIFDDRVDALTGFDDVKLLTVAVDRMRRWHRPGFLAIGDAAHAMSPIGGVGINLAVQDAVAAANRLAVPLRENRATEADLRAVQRRRLFAARAIQAAQVAIQNRIIGPALTRGGPARPPLLFRLLNRFPPLRRLAGRVIGLGVRPERVRAPAA
jgi:2-polyprenyl-6-methoxyphenol hydroxylase-like FAD-dependent oxidoreductase